MSRRLIARATLLLVCSLLLLVTWFRSAQPEGPGPGRIAFQPLRSGVGSSPAPGLKVEGVWQITGSGELFGGYSGLLARPDGTLMAIGDGGGRLDFSDPSLGSGRAAMSWLSDGPEVSKARRDAESLTSNATTGQFWVGYEFRNSIARFDPGKPGYRQIKPPEMRWWPNSGPEAIARLPDGRFAVIGEMQLEPAGLGCPALLFPADPIRGAKPVSFRFVPPRGYFASDMAALPDGRVLILIRRLVFPFPPMFAAQLLVADPSRIRAGEAWPWQRLAKIESPVPLDNYEGLAVTPRADGKLTLWLVSDDNAMVTQRSLLLKMSWDWQRATEKSARIAPRAF